MGFPLGVGSGVGSGLGVAVGDGVGGGVIVGGAGVGSALATVLGVSTGTGLGVRAGGDRVAVGPDGGVAAPGGAVEPAGPETPAGGGAAFADGTPATVCVASVDGDAPRVMIGPGADPVTDPSDGAALEPGAAPIVDGGEDAFSPATRPEAAGPGDVGARIPVRIENGE